MQNKILAFFGLLIFLGIIGCTKKIQQVNGEIIRNENYKGIILEKSKMDYIPEELNKYKVWIPNQKDIERAERILLDFIQSGSLLSMELNNYKRQYFGIIDNSEKIIYINSFCNIDEEDFKNQWKIEFVEVVDGGDCFFQVKVNLNQKRCFEFGINSEA